VTKGYGLTAHDINWSCPADLEPYSKAHMLEMKEKDTYIHAACGSYILSAVATAVEHNLAGRKAKSKYTQETIMGQIEKNKPLTEDEKQRQIDAFVQKMNTMKANFDASKGK
jgi:type IV pilus biogenesis protein CpaD/CtpE